MDFGGGGAIEMRRISISKVEGRPDWHRMLQRKRGKRNEKLPSLMTEDGYF